MSEKYIKQSFRLIVPPRTISMVSTIIFLLTIVQVDETDKSMTIYIYMMLEWYDGAYSINNGSELNELEIPSFQYEEIRRPSLAFLNSFDIEKLQMFGSDKFKYFWIYTEEPARFEYGEYLKIKLGCNFQFDTFPFDSHTCDLKFFCPSYDESMLRFTSIKIAQLVTVLRGYIHNIRDISQLWSLTISL